MKILIDADALPSLIKDILLRAAERLQISMAFVASKPISIPKSPLISCIVVPIGADAADHKIVELADAGDLVITADIPLADRVISKFGHAIDPRGWIYTPDNIKTKLAMRNLSDLLRSTGERMSGPSSFGKKDSQAFARQLDAFLTKFMKRKDSTSIDV